MSLSGGSGMIAWVRGLGSVPSARRIVTVTAFRGSEEVFEGLLGISQGRDYYRILLESSVVISSFRSCPF